MSHERLANDRPFAADDPALYPGWHLLDFLISLGADEFSLDFLYAGQEKEECSRLSGKLAFASLGKKMRECTSTYQGRTNPREIEVWRLDQRALEVLRELLPKGVLSSINWERAGAEDLCVYRDGELVFGTVTHEHYAFLRISDSEWKRWQERREEI
ncbi:MAG TPA: hypothetical protein VH518_11625 [Tepidisphaeraceae bacterium]|jgi:hypothetical protein